jgi:hypothetical protein
MINCSFVILLTYLAPIKSILPVTNIGCLLRRMGQDWNENNRTKNRKCVPIYEDIISRVLRCTYWNQESRPVINVRDLRLVYPGLTGIAQFSSVYGRMWLKHPYFITYLYAEIWSMLASSRCCSLVQKSESQILTKITNRKRRIEHVDL